MKTTKSPLGYLSQLLLWGTGGITLMGLLIVVSIWRTSDRALSLIGNLLKPEPIQPQIAELTPIIHRIQNIQELATTKQTVETVVPASAERKLGEISLATTRLLYLARGEIRAGIDLRELNAADIKIDQEQIEIDLPPAKILDSKIDVNYSRVYDYDRGFLNFGPDVAPQLQTLAQRKTLIEITNTACQAGILDTATRQTQAAIAELLAINGYKQVKINPTPPKACESPSRLSEPLDNKINQ